MSLVPGIVDPVRDWAAELDRLEAGATDALDRLGRDEAPTGGSWVPPTGLGPLPAALADRAREVLAAVERARVATAAVRDDVARQLSDGSGPRRRADTTRSTVTWDA